MDPAVDRFLGRFRNGKSNRHDFYPAASAVTLDAFERRHGVFLPPALRDLYACADGTDAVGEVMIRLLPLDEVTPAIDHPSASRDATDAGPGWADAPPWARRWFVVGDYLISSHAFLVRLSPAPGDPGPVASWAFGRDPDRWPIASNFADFLDLWTADDRDRLLIGIGDPMPPHDPGPAAPSVGPRR